MRPSRITGTRLSAAERTRWRKQARAWLHADLAAWAGTRDSGPLATRELAKQMLTLWRAEPDLAGLSRVLWESA